MTTIRYINNMASKHYKYIILSQTKLWIHQYLSIVNNYAFGFARYYNTTCNLIDFHTVQQTVQQPVWELRNNWTLKQVLSTVSIIIASGS